MKLYIAEKKSVGNAVAKFLGDNKNKTNTYIECGEDVVAWLQGHVLSLCEPEDYDGRYKKWEIDTLLYVPAVWKKKESKGKEVFVSNLRNLLKKADTVIHVGDPDREGQLLVDEVLEYCGWSGKTLRMWLNDVHPETIKKALGELKDNAGYNGLYNAGRAREYADWLVGLPLTRLATIQYRTCGFDIDGVISVGRVQTPTLGLVVRRDEEVTQFISKEYYVLFGNMKFADGRAIKGRWQPKKDVEYDFFDEENRIADKDAAAVLAAKYDGKMGTVVEITKQNKAINPPLPYNLPKLQIAVNKKYKIKNTLDEVQKLYEKGFVSYPRTNIRYLPENRHGESLDILNMLEVALPSMSGIIKNADATRKSAAWNDKEVKEHYGIIPTKKAPDLSEMSDMEQKIYEMICTRYVLQFLPKYEYEQTTVEFEAGGEQFKVTGRTIINIGWMSWDNEDEKVKTKEEEESEKEEDARELPRVRKGESGDVQAIQESKKTAAPKYFTFATLLDAMNSIHKYVSDAEIKKKLKEVSGIGTAATQENILKTLFARGFVEERKDRIYPTDLGRTLIASLRESKAAMMVTPDMTALWEEIIGKIENKEAGLDDFIGEMVQSVKEIISVPFLVKDTPETALPHKKKCLIEECEGFLTRRKNAEGVAFYSCGLCGKTFPEKDGMPVIREKKPEALKEAPCPKNCGNNARQYEGQYGKYWRCVCSPEETFRDAEGLPVLKESKKQEKTKCPTPRCKGEAVKLFKKADGSPFWKCDQCQRFFNDVDGKPVIQEKKGKK